LRGKITRGEFVNRDGVRRVGRVVGVS
jgi:hypothetical protein